MTWNVRAIVGTVFAVQDLGGLKPAVITEPAFGNDPLWSLSYEVAFYLLFPLLIQWHLADSPFGFLVALLVLVEVSRASSP